MFEEDEFVDNHLHLAALSGDEAKATGLLMAGADPNSKIDGDNAFCAALRSRSPKTLAALLGSKGSNPLATCDHAGNSLLARAILDGLHEQAMAIHSALPSSGRVPGSNGLTPCMAAASIGSAVWCSALSKADPAALADLDKNGSSPADFAEKNGWINLAKALREAMSGAGFAQLDALASNPAIDLSPPACLASQRPRAAM